MDTRPRRPRLLPRPFLLALTSLIPVAYSVWSLGVVARSGDIGLNCVLGTVLRDEVPAEFRWSPARPSEGDQLVSIDGRAMTHYPDYVAARRDLRDRIGDRVEVAWREGPDGPIQTARAEVARRPLRTYFWSLAWFVQEMAVFAVGLRVYARRSGDESARAFFWLCLVTVCAYMGGYHWTEIVVEPVLIYLFALFAMLVPLVSLHFYLVFPRVNPTFDRHRRAALLVLYGVPALILAAIWANMARISYLRASGGLAGSMASAAEVERAISWIKWLAIGDIGLSVAVFGLCIVCLVASYRAATNRAERNQAYWILLASWLSVLPIGYMLWRAFWEPARLGLSSAAWPMYVVSMLYTVAYALSITRYKLMQAEAFYNRSKVYVLVSLAAGLLYSAVLVGTTLLVGGRLLANLTSGGAAVAGVLAIVGLVLLEAVRGRLHRAIDRRFSREKYKFDEAMRRMNLAVGQLVDRATLGHRLLEAAADTLRLERGAIYLAAEAGGPLALTAWHGQEPRARVVEPTSPLVERLRVASTIRNAPSLPDSLGRDPAADALTGLGGEVARALSSDGEPVGLILLGPKRNGLAYEDEEVAFLNALGSVAMLALHSSGVQQTLERLNAELRDKVEKIAEQQRRILMLQGQLTDRRQSAGAGQEPRPAVGGEADGPLEAPSADPAPGRPDPAVFGAIRGSSRAVRSMLDVARKVAGSPSAVLIRGESGTGKELLAQAIHAAGPRASRPFVRVHCAALSQGLLESELFGHVKGAFTGADRDRVGRFEQANGGTLFLDEIGDISMEVQTKLLRVLQEMSFERVGSSQTVKVDVRIVAATHQDLEALIRQGRFREDLFYRLNVIPVRTPSLRERRDDVFELAVHFLGRHAGRIGRAVTHIDDDAVEALMAHDWPGNIRELENVVERAVVLADGPALTLDDLPPEVRRPSARRGGRPRSDPRGVSSPAPGRRGGNALAADRSTARSASTATIPRPSSTAGWPAGPLEAGPGSGPALDAHLNPDTDIDLEADAFERHRLIDALDEANGNKSGAARLLGLPRSTFFSKLKKHGLADRP